MFCVSLYFEIKEKDFRPFHNKKKKSVFDGSHIFRLFIFFFFTLPYCLSPHSHAPSSCLVCWKVSMCFHIALCTVMLIREAELSIHTILRTKRSHCTRQREREILWHPHLIYASAVNSSLTASVHLIPTRPPLLVPRRKLCKYIRVMQNVSLYTLLPS